MNKTNNNTCNYKELISKLRSMKLSAMAEAFERQIADPNSILKTFHERIQEIISDEWNLRYSKKYNRFLKKETLKYPDANFGDNIYDPDRCFDTLAIEHLSTNGWIDEHRNLLITGSTDSGKTYIANALCISAMRQFKTVRYVKSSALIYELEQANVKGEYLFF